DGGIVAQWVATGRVVNTVAEVFPHVVAITVPSYGNSTFFLASREPIDLTPDVLADRFAKVPEDAFSPAQRASVEEILVHAPRRCITNGRVATGLPASAVNRDLRPRDEYFINNARVTPELVAC
ncbi:MAG TPA: hypothetical protein VF183_10135, partial [Acidimicrobiales bacterium]